MAIDNKDNSKGNRPKTPFYLNWRFWAVLLAGLILVITVTFLVYTPKEIGHRLSTFLSDPTSYAPIGVVAGGIALVWSKFDEKIKDIRDKQREAETRRLIEFARNTEIEKKAETANFKANVVSEKVDAASERSDLLETRYEALSDMAYRLTEDLQQERDKSEAKIDRLETKIEELTKRDEARQQEISELIAAHKKEIFSMKAQMDAMGAENTKDKAELAVLRSRVTELEKEVTRLTVENAHYIEENRDLKQTRARRGTDPSLPALSSGDTVRLERIIDSGNSQE